MKLRKAMNLCTASLLSLSLIGGYGAMTISAQEDATVDESAFTKPTEEVSLAFWSALSGDAGDALNKLIEDYQAENPNIKVEVAYSGDYGETQAKLSTNLATNTAPDVVVAPVAAYTAGRGDYTMEALAEDPDFNKDDIFSGIWEYGMYMGRIGAIPFANSTPVMYYNKKVVEAAGIDMTNPPKTWEEFLETAALAQEKGNINESPVFWGFETNDPTWLFNSMCGQMGNYLVDIEGDEVIPTYNKEDAVEVGKLWQKFIDSNLMPAGEHTNAENVFLAGNCAFFAASSSRIPSFTLNENFEIGAMIMPTFGVTENTVAIGGASLATFSTDPVKLAASWDLIKYLTSTEKHAEFSLASGYLPIRKSSLETDVIAEAMEESVIRKAAFEQVETAWAYRLNPYHDDMYQIIQRAVEELEKGTDVQETLDDAVEELLREME